MASSELAAASARSASPWPYRAACALVGLGVRTFYRRVVVEGADHVPPRGPAIFAATHPNSVTDALVLGACVERPLRYLAHSGLFRRPLMGRLLRGFGVIPVFRPEDSSGPVDNRRMFEVCAEALASGAAIGVFPEGTSHRDERVRRLRTGTARIALEAEAAAHFTLGVRLVPVGLNFSAPGRFRSDVLVRIGLPIAVEAFRAAYRADPVAAVETLTAEIQRRLERLALELAAPELLPIVRRTARLLRDPAAPPADPSVEHAEARAVGEALAWAGRERPEDYAAFARRLEVHARSRRRFRLSDSDLSREPPPLPGAPTLLALPLALAGAALHALPYRLTGWIARRARPDPTKEAMVRFCAGLVLFVLWYAAQGALAWTLWGPRGAALVLALLSLGGWLALRWLPGWKAARGGVRPALLALLHPRQLERLRRERASLADAALGLQQAYRARQARW